MSLEPVNDPSATSGVGLPLGGLCRNSHRHQEFHGAPAAAHAPPSHREAQGQTLISDFAEALRVK